MTQHTLDAYVASEHLVQIKAKDGSLKEYYPAAWRLVELRLRHPHITIESEIILLDVEHNLVVIKAWIFDGRTYAESDHRASGTKQGLLSALDKVETGAKARAARDFGISTELALDMDEETTGAAGGQDASEQLTAIKSELKTLGLVRNPSQWAAWKKTAIGRDLADNKLTAGHIAKMKAALEQAKSKAA
jgi:hypothetical protein